MLLRKHTDSSVSLNPSRPYLSPKVRAAGRIVFIIASALIVVFLWPTSRTYPQTPTNEFVTLKASGGQETFTIVVSGVKDCVWSSLPKVPGFDQTVKCPSGREIRTVTFAPNTSGHTKHYKISINADLRTNHLETVQFGGANTVNPNVKGGPPKWMTFGFGTYWQITQYSEKYKVN